MFSIKKATFEDMAFILRLAENEGWNPGLNDAIPFYACDKNGFFLADLNDEKIGCISAVAYNPSFGFIGLYIIKPEFRHQGYGIQLWQTAMDYLSQRNIGLDGVIEQQSNYKKSGFKLYYRNIRFALNQSLAATAEDILDLKHIPISQLLKYDSTIFGMERFNFIHKWIQMNNANSIVKINKNTQEVIGYGVMRECIKGYKIGPLFADTYEIANEIFCSLCSKINSGPVYLDVPEINLNALRLAEKYNMTKVFETARMYTQEPPQQPLNKIFGITTFELG